MSRVPPTSHEGRQVLGPGGVGPIFARELGEARGGQVRGEGELARAVDVGDEQVHLAPRSPGGEAGDLREVRAAEQLGAEAHHGAAAERGAADGYRRSSTADRALCRATPPGSVRGGGTGPGEHLGIPSPAANSFTRVARRRGRPRPPPAPVNRCVGARRRFAHHLASACDGWDEAERPCVAQRDFASVAPVTPAVVPVSAPSGMFDARRSRRPGHAACTAFYGSRNRSS
jgi:hypothetical protein